MNFFTLGYLLLTFQLNFTWILGYSLKLLGMVFMVGGIIEISSECKDFNKLMKLAKLSSGVMVLCTLAQVAVKFLNVSEKTFVVVSIANAIISVATCFWFLKNLMDKLIKNSRMVNDMSNISNLCSKWRGLMFLTGLNLVCNILYQFLATEKFKAYAGVVVVYSNIAIIIMCIYTTWIFYKVRCDFNKKNSLINNSIIEDE